MTGRYADIVGEQLAGRIRAAQLRSVLRHMGTMMFVSLVNGAIVVAVLWNTATHALLIGWAAALAFAVGIAVAPRLKAAPHTHPTRASRGVIGRITRNALIFGLIWGAVPTLFFNGAPAGAGLVITCVSAGMIGGGAFAFASVPAAAIAMIVPIGAGSIWALLQTAESGQGYVILMVSAFCSLLLRGVMVHALDATRQFAKHSEIEQLSKRDSLTNLDNRATFRGIVAEALLRLENAQEPCAVFFIDLDDLKRFNELHGNSVGDELLVAAAKRLRELARRADRVARLDSDQFAILAPNLSGEATIRAYATRIAQAFEPSFALNRLTLDIAVCVGVHVAQAKGLDVDTLLRRAELALQKAQRNGAGSFHVFGANDDAALLERNSIEQDLRFALERNELTVAFQPMLRAVDQRVTGFEALLRWNHPARGSVPPSVFIPIAEESGMIGAFGAWVLRQACLTAAAWPRDIRVCVNVSAFQLTSPALGKQVAAALEAADLEPQRLEIEITETVLVSEDPLPLEILTDLRATGVRLALDDFGIGYSSLSYLRRLPFDRIKIDRSFVTDIVANRDCAAIVKAIVGLASDLGLDVIAEGIETPDQLEALRQLKCPEVQGYLLGKPMYETDIAAYLKAGVTLAAA